MSSMPKAPLVRRAEGLLWATANNRQRILKTTKSAKAAKPAAQKPNKKHSKKHGKKKASKANAAASK